MVRVSSLALATVCLLILTVAIQSQEQGTNLSNLPRSPSVTVIQQQNAAVTLKISSIKSIAGKPGLVKLIFKAQGAAAVKGYHFHYEEMFVDEYGAEASVVTDSTSLRSVRNEEDFVAHANAKIKVWVSEVEFVDGSKWQSTLVPKLKREK